MIDLKYVQALIEKEISPDFEIREYFDTTDMVIVFWKHKIYDTDDERGHIIGAGPVVYDKTTKEYRVLGSREWFSEEICRLFETDETKEKMQDHEYLMNLFENNEEDSVYSRLLTEKIKASILRRNYINSEDIDFLSILTGARRLDKKFEMKGKPEWNHTDHCVVVSGDREAKEKLISIWKEINFGYQILSETELLLFRIRN
ncbi:hypothetical protein [Chryseobacterium arthrosphaerae]|uniref:Uncharacterized protein n=1 Tax=Chryseobacterium arthrosphaerae TaxID=651561 RepID=A0A1B8ZUQ9_9FLAO|nr:hypothetical protein [Chryseobacterium arthrosphaerae]OCA75328.1 hypothetical protein BBI00_13745 [Chryseobacterium arthrosphaerae]